MASTTRAPIPRGFDGVHKILGKAMRAADPSAWPARPHRNGPLPVLFTPSQLEIGLALCDLARPLSPRVTAFEPTVALAQVVASVRGVKVPAELARAVANDARMARANLEQHSAPARSDPPSLKIAKLAVRAAKNFLYSPPSARTAVGVNVENAAAALVPLVPDLPGYLLALDQLVLKAELVAHLSARGRAPAIELVISRPAHSTGALGAIFARLADGSFGLFVKLRTRWEWHEGDLRSTTAMVPDALLEALGDDIADLGIR